VVTSRLESKCLVSSDKEGEASGGRKEGVGAAWAYTPAALSPRKALSPPDWDYVSTYQVVDRLG